MNEFIHARIDEASAGGSAPGAPDYAEDARKRKAMAAQSVDAADAPVSPPLGAKRVGRAGRKRKQPDADPAPAEKKTLFVQKGVSKEECTTR